MVEWDGKACGHDGNGNGVAPKYPNDGSSRWFVDCGEIEVISSGESALLDFIGLQQLEQVANFYNGGLGGNGSGPGPDFGAAFSDARTYYTYNGCCSPNPGVIATISGPNMVINLDGLISGIAFHYSATVNVTVKAYSGVSGTGDVLATYVLSPNTSGGSSTGAYNTWQPVEFVWSIGASSIVLSGNTNHWGIDQVSYAIAPPCNTGDCNKDGICDDDQLPGNDCNGNNVLDSCDIASGTSQDCNANQVPDSCDLANGTSQDCNENSIPDSCDIASGRSSDPEGDGIPNSCEPDPGVTMSGPGNTAPGQCSAIGDEVTFDVSVLNPPIVTVAGQFNVVYDRAVLEYVGISGGDAPITDILVSSHDASNGSIFWISTIPIGGSGTLADLRVASLRFRVIADDCDGGVHASFDEGFAPVLIANDGGVTADLPLTQPASFVIDTTGPVLSGVPADLSVPADAGSGCFAAREFTPPTVIDNCSDADLVITRSDGQPLGAPWACGTTTVTWSATDGCGRTAQAMTMVTVEPYHLLDLRLAYAGSGYASSMGRCIDIDLGDVEAAVAMTFAGGVGIETIQVPVGSYGCATADDDLHSLVSTGSVVIEGTRYVLALAGTAALVNGDVTDDNLINVADWGVIVTRIGSMQPADVNCSTAGFHVDFNGDGAVTQADGNFIISNLLRTGASGCGALTGGTADDGAMTVDQLAAIVGPDAILADLNGDGMVDLDDVGLWAAGRERRGDE
ncbi:MAG: hypothetical protein FJ270_09985 [Planctomycetes bacterium]|nr:hypothetical protein [Planctomycetota bacterium]